MVLMDYSDVARDFLKLAGIAEARPGATPLGRLAHSFGRLPYENLTKILRAAEYPDTNSRLRMPDIILSDHLDFGAGGTCFSLTNFFEHILKFSGYETSTVLCDRSYGPATHCALIVKINNQRFLVDPGYLMSDPILIPQRGESIQRQGTGIVRLVRLGESSQIILATECNGKKKIRYRFRDISVSRDQFRARWIDSFDWAMMRHMCVSKNINDGQLYMRDGLMRAIKSDHNAQERIKNRFADEIEKVFGIDRRITGLAHDAVKRLR